MKAPNVFKKVKRSIKSFRERRGYDSNESDGDSERSHQSEDSDELSSGTSLEYSLEITISETGSYRQDSFQDDNSITDTLSDSNPITERLISSKDDINCPDDSIEGSVEETRFQKVPVATSSTSSDDDSGSASIERQEENESSEEDIDSTGTSVSFEDYSLDSDEESSQTTENFQSLPTKKKGLWKTFNRVNKTTYSSNRNFKILRRFNKLNQYHIRESRQEKQTKWSTKKDQKNKEQIRNDSDESVSESEYDEDDGCSDGDEKVNPEGDDFGETTAIEDTHKTDIGTLNESSVTEESRHNSESFRRIDEGSKFDLRFESAQGDLSKDESSAEVSLEKVFDATGYNLNCSSVLTKTSSRTSNDRYAVEGDLESLHSENIVLKSSTSILIDTTDSKSLTSLYGIQNDKYYQDSTCDNALQVSEMKRKGEENISIISPARSPNPTVSTSKMNTEIQNADTEKEEKIDNRNEEEEARDGSNPVLLSPIGLFPSKQSKKSVSSPFAALVDVMSGDFFGRYPVPSDLDPRSESYATGPMPCNISQSVVANEAKIKSSTAADSLAEVLDTPISRSRRKLLKRAEKDDLSSRLTATKSTSSIPKGSIRQKSKRVPHKVSQQKSSFQTDSRTSKGPSDLKSNSGSAIRQKDFANPPRGKSPGRRPKSTHSKLRSADILDDLSNPDFLSVEAESIGHDRVRVHKRRKNENAKKTPSSSTRRVETSDLNESKRRKDLVNNIEGGSAADKSDGRRSLISRRSDSGPESKNSSAKVIQDEEMSLKSITKNQRPDMASIVDVRPDESDDADSSVGVPLPPQASGLRQRFERRLREPTTIDVPYHLTVNKDGKESMNLSSLRLVTGTLEPSSDKRIDAETLEASIAQSSEKAKSRQSAFDQSMAKSVKKPDDKDNAGQASIRGQCSESSHKVKTGSAVSAIGRMEPKDGVIPNESCQQSACNDLPHTNSDHLSTRSGEKAFQPCVEVTMKPVLSPQKKQSFFGRFRKKPKKTFSRSVDVLIEEVLVRERDEQKRDQLRTKKSNGDLKLGERHSGNDRVRKKSSKVIKNKQHSDFETNGENLRPDTEEKQVMTLVPFHLLKKLVFHECKSSDEKISWLHEEIMKQNPTFQCATHLQSPLALETPQKPKTIEDLHKTTTFRTLADALSSDSVTDLNMILQENLVPKVEQLNPVNFERDDILVTKTEYCVPLSVSLLMKMISCESSQNFKEIIQEQSRDGCVPATNTSFLPLTHIYSMLTERGITRIDFDPSTGEVEVTLTPAPSIDDDQHPPSVVSKEESLRIISILDAPNKVEVVESKRKDFLLCVDSDGDSNASKPSTLSAVLSYSKEAVLGGKARKGNSVRFEEVSEEREFEHLVEYQANDCVSQPEILRIDPFFDSAVTLQGKNQKGAYVCSKTKMNTVLWQSTDDSLARRNGLLDDVKQEFLESAPQKSNSQGNQNSKEVKSDVVKDPSSELPSMVTGKEDVSQLNLALRDTGGLGVPFPTHLVVNYDAEFDGSTLTSNRSRRRDDNSTIASIQLGVSAWKEIYEASLVVERALKQFDSPKSNPATPKENKTPTSLIDVNSIDQVEKALETLKSHAQRLGVKESDLLLAVKTTDDEDDLKAVEEEHEEEHEEERSLTLGEEIVEAFKSYLFKKPA